MKEIILSICLAVGFIPAWACTPPEVCMDGLSVQTVIETPLEMPLEQPTSYESYFTERDIELIAKTLYGECRGCIETEQAKVAWCILNRVDDKRFPNTIEDVVTQPYQFHGYSSSFPVCEKQYEIAKDVLERWAAEKTGAEIERELPSTYCWFYGDGANNYFREKY